ncbi:hypothetical protein BOQ62_01410 [Chryseobacterium sp. CH21]|nr:hypothetical protein BOQ62_01410 [Chryseobacterium sp. CH21]
MIPGNNMGKSKMIVDNSAQVAWLGENAKLILPYIEYEANVMLNKLATMIIIFWCFSINSLMFFCCKNQ